MGERRIMKIDELIQELEEVREEHGNLEVHKACISKREFIKVEYHESLDEILI